MLYDNDLLLLPAESKGVIFQYHPQPTITCFLPPARRKLTVTIPSGTRTIEIATPPLVWTWTFWRNNHEHPVNPQNTNNAFCICNNCIRMPKFFSEYRLYAVHPKSPGSLSITPYLLGNVYEEGKICWGKHNNNGFYETPDNLRQGNGIFWSAPFNMDLWSVFKMHHEHKPAPCPKKDHQCANKKRVDEYTKLVNDPELVGPIAPPPSLCGIMHYCHNKQIGGPKCAGHKCAGFQTYKITGDGTGLCQGEKTANNTKARPKCPCCSGRCECGMCLCCVDRCECRLQCHCCYGKCACRCSCDLNALFLEHFTNYDPGKEGQWKDHQKVLCGEGYIATPHHADAIFISSNPELLKHIPDEEHSYNHLGETIVTGWANRHADGKGWVIQINDRQVYMENKYINFCASGGKTLSTTPLPSSEEREIASPSIGPKRNRLKQKADWRELLAKVRFRPTIKVHPKPVHDYLHSSPKYADFCYTY